MVAVGWLAGRASMARCSRKATAATTTTTTTTTKFSFLQFPLIFLCRATGNRMHLRVAPLDLLSMSAIMAAPCLVADLVNLALLANARCR